MIISEDLLLTYGADYETFESNQIIFHEGTLPKFYFQIVTGIVELNNYHEDGKEFTQNVLSAGQSIGESLLFNEKEYPVNAIARTECIILKLAKKEFINLLHENQEASSEMLKCLADRLYHKYIMLFNNSLLEPSVKIKALMDYFKNYNNKRDKFSFEIPFTRQQLANLTGLRVETVIRTVKKMESQRLLKISDRKIYY